MDLEELRRMLAALEPGKMAGLHRDVYADLFPPGEPDERARAACFSFARSVGCSIDNSAGNDSIWFVKDA